MSLLRYELDAKEIADKLDADGFVTIENIVDQGWLERAADSVGQLIDKQGKRYFALNDIAREPDTPSAELARDPAVRKLMTQLSKLGNAKAKLDDEIYTCLRVVAGASGDSKSLLHHYDKYVVTVLAPILIPEGPRRRAGELIVFPNRRGFRPFAWMNIAEKAIVQSDWYRQRFTKRLPKGDEQIKYLKPGNLYIFWGYRTFHSNFPVVDGVVRATLLMHYGDPHPSSLILRAVKAMQIRRERATLPKAQWH